MDDLLEPISRLLGNTTYANQGLQSIRSRDNKIRNLITHRKCPDRGWKEEDIEYLLSYLAKMDSNHFPDNAMVGERESRILCSLVARRHHGLGHGIGRSGDLLEIQPKAAGSSLLNVLTNSMILDLVQKVGSPNTKAAFICPVATGMAMTLTLLTLRKMRPDTAKYVIWSRIDQKSCFKSILTAGFIPVIIEPSLDPLSDGLVTNIIAIKEKIDELGSDSVVCVATTTSCFAPRAPDNIIEVAKLCQAVNVPHVVNNAYGLQSTKLMHLIEQGSRKGRIDAYIQSTDKNLLVPVGGSIIAGFDEAFIFSIAKIYPGRASASPMIDAFITLLHLGVDGYRDLVKERKDQMTYLKVELDHIANKFNERVLRVKENPISIALTLDHVSNLESISQIGSMLFLRNVSGARVLASNTKIVEGHTFKNWGQNCDNYAPASCYLTAAAAIGITKEDTDNFIKRLEKILKKCHEPTSPPLSDSVLK